MDLLSSRSRSILHTVSHFVLVHVRWLLDTLLQLLRACSPRLYNVVDVVLLYVSCIFMSVGFGSVGAVGLAKCKQPEKTLILYEMEGCPCCARVRLALNVLGLDYISYPCPRETLVHYGVVLNSRYRPEARKSGGVLMFPYFVDNNTSIRMYNSSDIVAYLWSVYGARASKPLSYRVVTSSLYSSLLVPVLSLIRPSVDMGVIRVASRQPEQLLEVWGSEVSPMTKRVRELLTILEIAHVMHVMPLGGANRKKFRTVYGPKLSWMRRTFGLCKIPLLYDANTGRELFGSNAICDYIKSTYQVGGSDTQESWRCFNSTNPITQRSGLSATTGTSTATGTSSTATTINTKQRREKSTVPVPSEDHSRWDLMTSEGFCNTSDWDALDEDEREYHEDHNKREYDGVGEERQVRGRKRDSSGGPIDYYEGYEDEMVYQVIPNDL